MKGPFRDREREAYAERFREGQKMIARLNAEAEAESRRERIRRLKRRHEPTGTEAADKIEPATSPAPGIEPATSPCDSHQEKPNIEDIIKSYKNIYLNNEIDDLHDSYIKKNYKIFDDLHDSYIKNNYIIEYNKSVFVKVKEYT